MFEYQLVHQIPGRLRLKINKKLNFSECVTQVQEKITHLKGVNQVRVNALAHSVIINFNDDILSNSQVLELLDSISEGDSLKTKTTVNPVLETNIPTKEDSEKVNQPLVEDNWQFSLIICQPLSAYEKKQIEEIFAWQSQHPNILVVNIAHLLTPVINITSSIIPQEIIKHSLMRCEEVAQKWNDHWEKFKSQAQVTSLLELQKGNLERCDRLVEKVKTEMMISGTLELGGIAVIRGIGELASIPLSIIIALQTIQQVALCYGYAPESKGEKFFAWTILAITTAQTPEDQHKAFSSFYNCVEATYQQNFSQILEEILTEEFMAPLKEEIFHQSVSYLAKNLSVELIPLVGYVAEVAINGKFIEEISEAAIRSYQIKWLISNQKIQLQSKNDLSVTPVKEVKTNNPGTPKRKTNTRKKSTNT